MPAGSDATAAANKALVARYYQDVLNRRDLGALDELLAPDFRSHSPDGRAGAAAGYPAAGHASHQAVPDLAVEIADQLAEGDRVATRWTAHGTHRGPFAGIPATGRRIAAPAIPIHRTSRGGAAR